MIVSCAPWVLCQVTGLSTRAVTTALKATADKGHIKLDSAGNVIGLTQPGIIQFLEDFEVRIKLLNPELYRGRDDEPVTAAEWAIWLGRRDPSRPYLLIQPEHVLLAQNSFLFDNVYQGGIDPKKHPVGHEPVLEFSTGEGAMVTAIKPLKPSAAYGRMQCIAAATGTKRPNTRPSAAEARPRPAS